MMRRAPMSWAGLESTILDIRYAWRSAMTFDPGVFSNSDASLFRILGRLADRASPEQLRSRLQAVFQDRQRAVIAHSSTFQRGFARPMWIVWSVAAAILLVACANVFERRHGLLPAHRGELRKENARLKQLVRDGILRVHGGLLNYCDARRVMGYYGANRSLW
jgi:hypothetical protein